VNIALERERKLEIRRVRAHAARRDRATARIVIALTFACTAMSIVDLLLLAVHA
jgi:uncharacterized membrane protein